MMIWVKWKHLFYVKRYVDHVNGYDCCTMSDCRFQSAQRSMSDCY